LYTDVDIGYLGSGLPPGAIADPLVPNANASHNGARMVLSQQPCAFLNFYSK